MADISPQIITAFFVGVSALVSAALGFAYKIWRDHNRMIREMNEKLVKITEKNSSANEKISASQYKLSDNIAENTRATAASTDMLSKLMLELIRNKN